MSPPEIFPHLCDGHTTAYTQRDIDKLVAAGRIMFIAYNKVYDVTRWAPYHPGGALALKHGCGRDVTNELAAMHPESVLTTRLPKFVVGVFLPTHTDADIGDGRTSAEHHELTMAYPELYKQVKAMGLFNVDYYNYLWEIARFITFFCLSLYFLRFDNIYAVCLSAVCMGFFWIQASFTVHDLGHNAVTGIRNIDWNLGIFIAGFGGGLSVSWWKDSHNVHHIITNHPEHDPDIQHMPFFAVTERFFTSLWSSYHNHKFQWDLASKFLVSIQHYTYYLVLTFGRFNLYVQSLLFLLARERGAKIRHKEPKRWAFECICMALFWVWYLCLVATISGWGNRLLFVYISHAVTGILHVQITLSHFGMSTEDFGPQESFIARQMRTTMDINCPIWFDWFHGGLQFQAMHHLFPRAPRHKLRQIQKHVGEFCIRKNIEYTKFGFISGNSFVLGKLKQVADKVWIPLEGQ